MRNFEIIFLAGFTNVDAIETDLEETGLQETDPGYPN